MKSFQGEGLDDWVADRKQDFDSVLITKPKASRPHIEAVAGAVVRRGRLLLVQRPETGLLAGDVLVIQGHPDDIQAAEIEIMAGL